MQGGWLYSLHQPQTVHILCPGLVDKIVVLEVARIFHLSANCLERTRSTPLNGIRDLEVRRKTWLTQN